MARLEKHLRVTLLVRRQGARVSGVTHDGRRIHARATELYRRSQLLDKQLAELGDSAASLEVVRELRVGATNSVATYVLPAAIASFCSRSRRPLQLALFEDDYPQLIARLHRGDLDFAVGPAVPNWRSAPYIEFETLSDRIDSVLIGPYKMQIGAKLDLNALGLRLRREKLHVLHKHLQPNVWEDWPSPDWQRGGGIVFHSTYNSITSSVIAGGGYGIVVGLYRLLDDFRNQKTLSYVDVSDALGRGGMAVYRTKSHELSLLGEEFIKVVKAEVSRLTLSRSES